MADLIKTTNGYYMQAYTRDTTSATGIPGYTYKSRVSSYTKSSQVGSTLPNYKDRIAKMQDASTGYSCEHSNIMLQQAPAFTATANVDPIENSLSWEEFTQIGSPSFVSCTIPSHIAIDTNIIADLNSSVIEKMHRKVGKVRANPQTIPFIMEAGELARIAPTIQLALMDLVQSGVELRRRNFGRSSRALFRAFGDLWLTWSFGISPVIRDTKELAGALADVLNDFYDTERVRTMRAYSLQSINSVGVGAWDMSSVSNFCSSKISYLKTTEYTYGIQGVMYINTTPVGSWDRFLDRFNLSPDNWIPAMWELLPFSWIVDYFTNCGKFLDLVCSEKPKWVYLNQTTKRRTTARLEQSLIRNPSLNKGYNFTMQPGIYEASRTTFDRAVFTDIGIPPFEIRMLTLSEISKFSLGKLLNLISLLKPRR